MTATKKISALLFTLLGLVPLLFIVITIFKQQKIRHHMKQQLSSQMLHTINLAKNDVIWVKEGKEILINGRMFDIKSFQSAANDMIRFSGLFDDEETTLVNELSKNQQKENNHSGKLLAQLFQLLQASFSHTPGETFDPLLNNRHFQATEQDLSSVFKTILTPPPQV